MDIIEVSKFDETYNKITCDPGIGFELNDHFLHHHHHPSERQFNLMKDERML